MSSVSRDSERPANGHGDGDDHPGGAGRRLTAWSRVHAVLALAACAGAAALGHSWPLAPVALLSFGALVWRGRGTFTPRGTFGPANAVTAIRLGIALALALVGGDAPGGVVTAALAVSGVLDGLDGWLARRCGAASAFGATFDMETDALLVLVVDLLLWQRGRFGAWILVAGLLRYAYVLALAIVAPPAGHVPRSRLGRFAFLTVLAGLAVAFVRQDAVGTALAALGTAAVVASFARSFHWSYRRS